MKIKTVFITVGITFVVCFGINGLFHALIMADYFDEAFAGFGSNIHKMKEGNPAWLAATEIVWISSLFYLLTFKNQKLNTRQAIIGGMLMNASVSATWNFINASLFAVFPASIILPDLAFHILVVGPITGLLIASLYNKLERK